MKRKVVHLAEHHVRRGLLSMLLGQCCAGVCVPWHQCRCTITECYDAPSSRHMLLPCRCLQRTAHRVVARKLQTALRAAR